jgi:hypothetical protein
MALFDDAEALLNTLPRGNLRAPIAMLAVYRALLAELRRRGWRDPTRPCRLSAPRKALIALSAFVRARP